MLYRKIDLPSNEPVNFVGVHPLKWGEKINPEVGFIEIEEDGFEKIAEEKGYVREDKK